MLVAIANDHLFVTERKKHRVQIIGMDGKFVGVFGSHGSVAGQFNGPAGIVIIDAELFVVDKRQNRIQVFNDVRWLTVRLFRIPASALCH